MARNDVRHRLKWTCSWLEKVVHREMDRPQDQSVALLPHFPLTALVVVKSQQEMKEPSYNPNLKV